MIVQLGNPAPVEVIPVHVADEAGALMYGENGEKITVDERRPIDHPDAVTTIQFPPDTDVVEAFTNICHQNGAWNRHADDPPTWVASDNAVLASLLSQHFGCPVQALPEDGE